MYYINGNLYRRIFNKINSNFDAHVILALFFCVNQKSIFKNHPIGSFHIFAEVD